jgi:flagellar basal body-associated protein FliL
MKNKIIAIVILVVLLVVSIYGYEMIFKKPLVESPTQQDIVEVPMPTLDVKTQYQNGTHIVAGTIQTPTPCHTVVAQAEPMGTSTYAINISVAAPASDVMCAQVISDKKFKVSFKAPQDIEMKAFINGEEYKINPFEVPAGQNIDLFDISIKG